MTADKPTRSDWQAAASKEVKGKDIVWRTPEGIEVRPLYTREDAEGIDPGLPGRPRGATAPLSAHPRMTARVGGRRIWP